ncbi:hypothetical protein HNY73_004112 [Argiope bruennichi]|uniref:Uncharacterized protein n=1 Tax=Argiope bruennichi TaxID=94029 RepID=A0A8T0FQS1_ARGBR|nr:hypothetical protein HNY73_004112 [Argiope bruennichi]
MYKSDAKINEESLFSFYKSILFVKFASISKQGYAKYQYEKITERSINSYPSSLLIFNGDAHDDVRDGVHDDDDARDGGHDDDGDRDGGDGHGDGDDDGHDDGGGHDDVRDDGDGHGDARDDDDDGPLDHLWTDM